MGTEARSGCFFVTFTTEAFMFKGGLLWLLGIPLPIILVLWLLGYLN